MLPVERIDLVVIFFEFFLGLRGGFFSGGGWWCVFLEFFSSFLLSFLWWGLSEIKLVVLAVIEEVREDL